LSHARTRARARARTHTHTHTHTHTRVYLWHFAKNQFYLWIYITILSYV